MNLFVFKAKNWRDLVPKTSSFRSSSCSDHADNSCFLKLKSVLLFPLPCNLTIRDRLTKCLQRTGSLAKTERRLPLSEGGRLERPVSTAQTQSPTSCTENDPWLLQSESKAVL